jgi:hypothetical protein
MDQRLIWTGIVSIVLAVLCLLYSVYCSERKKIADASELDYLDELMREHELRIADHHKKLEWLIRIIENNQPPSKELNDRLSRVQRMLQNTIPPVRDDDKTAEDQKSS